MLTGDDHGNGGTAGQFDTYEADSPPGCSVADWQCVRSTSYVFPSTPTHRRPGAGLPGATGSRSRCISSLEARLRRRGCNDFTLGGAGRRPHGQLRRSPSVAEPRGAASPAAPTASSWSDWATRAEGRAASTGSAFDTNYYYWPAAWVQNRPGMFTGSGFPMRFADLDGSLIDVYQAATQLTDESGIDVDAHIRRAARRRPRARGLLRRLHREHAHRQRRQPRAPTRSSPRRRRAACRSSPRSRCSTWLDGRNGSSFQGLSFSGGHAALRGRARRGRARPPGDGARRARHGRADRAHARRRAGRTSTRRTVKGIDYAIFDAAAGDYVATLPRRP